MKLIVGKIKRLFGIIGNTLLFPLVFPLSITNYIKREIPFLNSFVFLINMIVWFCFLLFAMGLFINKLGWEEHAPNWMAEIVKNPYNLIQSSFFGWGLLFLSLFYLLAIWKEWWEVDRLKKEIKEFVFDDVEK